MLAEVVRRSEESIHDQAWEAGIAVTSFVDPALPETFPTDSARLLRLLSLLLDGGVSQARTEVFLRVEAEPGSLRLSVSSDGAPFPEPTPHQIFEPYDPSALALRKRRGRTLALPLARALARALGGRLDLDNPRGRPTFLLHLPLPPAAPPAPP
jgi:K+-sensing histidine kinase KdpD